MKLTNKQFIFAALFSIISLYNYSQVGINTTDPKTTLDVDGAIALREGAPINLSNGDNHNIVLETNARSLYRITGPTTSFSISGIVPQASADGQMLTLENTTNTTLTLKHDTGSTAANRIYCPSEKDFILTGRYAAVTLQYNSTQKRWIITNHADSRYGDNMQSVILPSGTQNITATGGTHTDITGASITFTPRHATIYLSFTVSGYNPLDGVNGPDQKSWFAVRVLNDGVNTANFVSISAANDDLSGAVGASTITAANFPLTVTPNVPVTIKLQGTTGGVTFEDGFTIDRTNYTSFLTILD